MNAVLELRQNPRTRLLFGLLIALVAGVLLLATDGTLADRASGGLLLATAVAVVAWRNRIVVDSASGQLLHERRLIVPLRRRQYPLRRIRAVTLLVAATGSGDNRRPRYVVRLSGIRHAVVLSHANPWFSRVVAEQLARRLRVPLNNRMYGRSSRRRHDELDLPLARRWARDNTRFEPPALPDGTGLRERADGTAYVLSMPAEFPKLKYLAVGLFVASAASLAIATRAPVFGTALVLFLALAGLLVLAFVGRSQLTIDNNEVSFRQGLLPFSNSIAIGDIEELVVAADGITLIGDVDAVWIHWAGNRQDSDYLTAAVPYRLSRAARTVTADGHAGSDLA